MVKWFINISLTDMSSSHTYSFPAETAAIFHSWKKKNRLSYCKCNYNARKILKKESNCINSRCLYLFLSFLFFCSLFLSICVSFSNRFRRGSAKRNNSLCMREVQGNYPISRFVLLFRNPCGFVISLYEPS